jgi:hypothetical protein
MGTNKTLHSSLEIINAQRKINQTSVLPFPTTETHYQSCTGVVWLLCHPSSLLTTVSLSYYLQSWLFLPLWSQSSLRNGVLG